MKIHRSQAALAALGAAALFGVAACGSGGTKTSSGDSGSGKGNILIQAHEGQKGEVDALKAAVTAFNASQTDIKAELKLVPEKAYGDTLKATYTSGSNIPDVVEFDGPTLSSFAFDQRLAPLDGVVDKAVLDAQLASLKAQGTYNGKLYGVGMFDSGLGVYGNKKLLDAAGVKYPTSLDAGWTAAEFQAAVVKLAAKDADKKVLDIKENYGGGEWNTYGFSPIVWSAGGGLVDTKTGKASGVLDKPEVVAAMKTFQSWKPFIDPNKDDKSFTSGKAALSWVGHWVYGDYSKALGKDLVIMPLPDFGQGPKTGQGSWAWGASAAGKNQAAAGKFLNFLLNDTNIGAMTKANGAVPGSTTAVAASDLYKTGGPLELFVQGLNKSCGDQAPSPSCVAVPRPLTAGYNTVTKEFGNAVTAVLQGTDPAAALGKAAKAIDQDFGDNNNYQPKG
jgi:multiple sugar transport system substrate-binding protein